MMGRILSLAITLSLFYVEASAVDCPEKEFLYFPNTKLSYEDAVHHCTSQGQEMSLIQELDKDLLNNVMESVWIQTEKKSTDIECKAARHLGKGVEIISVPCSEEHQVVCRRCSSSIDKDEKLRYLQEIDDENVTLAPTDVPTPEPTSTPTFLTVPRCLEEDLFTLVDGSFTFEEAEDMCGYLDNSTIARISSEEELFFVQGFKLTKSVFWIGIQSNAPSEDPADFFFIDGQQDVSFFNVTQGSPPWQPGFPNSRGECVFSLGNGRFRDDPCTVLRAVLCRKQTSEECIEEVDGEDNSDSLIVIGGAVGGGFLFLLVLILVIFWQAKNKKETYINRPNVSSEKYNNSGASSTRSPIPALKSFKSGPVAQAVTLTNGHPTPPKRDATPPKQVTAPVPPPKTPKLMLAPKAPKPPQSFNLMPGKAGGPPLLSTAGGFQRDDVVSFRGAAASTKFQSSQAKGPPPSSPLRPPPGVSMNPSMAETRALYSGRSGSHTGSQRSLKSGNGSKAGPPMLSSVASQSNRSVAKKKVKKRRRVEDQSETGSQATLDRFYM